MLQFNDASNRIEVLYPNAVLTSEHGMSPLSSVILPFKKYPGSLSLMAHDSLIMRDLPASTSFVVQLPFLGSLHGTLVKVSMLLVTLVLCAEHG